MSREPDIVERLHVVRDHLRTGRFGQREVWEEWLTEAADEIERLQDTIRFANKVMDAKDAEIERLRTQCGGNCRYWEDRWRDEAKDNERLRAAHFEVVQLQPGDDCPGLWIGFKTGKDRDEAMKLFTIAEPKP